MTGRVFSRRAALGAALAGLVGTRPAAAQLFGGSQPAAATSFRAVAADLGPVLDHGGGAWARTFAEVLGSKLHGVFADRLVPGDKRAPLLTARITNVYFYDYVGIERPYAFGSNDNIEGDGIVSQGGRVLSSTHVLTELPPAFSGAYYTQGIDARRMDSIAYQFAYWLRREMNI